MLAFPKRRVTPAAVPICRVPSPKSDLSVHSLFYGVYDVSGGWALEHPCMVKRHFGEAPIRRPGMLVVQSALAVAPGSVTAGSFHPCQARHA
jgi:hypothetical protein